MHVRLSTETWVDRPRDQVFPFFADAANLGILTPPWLRFSIRTALPICMEAGREIAYRISLRGLPLWWTSRIVRYEPPELFADEQLRGPYRSWMHVHYFDEDRGGTLLRDEVDCDVYAGWLVGGFVVGDLRRIFAYRHNALLRIFDQPHPWPSPRIRIETSGRRPWPTRR